VVVAPVLVVTVPLVVPSAEVWLAGIPSDEPVLLGSVKPRCVVVVPVPGTSPAEAAGLLIIELSEPAPPLQELQC
jgi:hypothetical protein